MHYDKCKFASNLFNYYYYQLISIRSCTKIHVPTLPTYITGKLDMAGMKSCLTRRHRLVWNEQSFNLRSWILRLFKYLQEIVRSGQGPVKLFPCLQHEFTHIWNKRQAFEDNFLHYKLQIQTSLHRFEIPSDDDWTDSGVSDDNSHSFSHVWKNLH